MQVFKFLGVLLDINMNFLPHFHVQLQASQKMFAWIRTFSGLPPNLLLIIYNTTVLPKLLYDCRCWHLSLPKAGWTLIDQILRSSLLKLLRGIITTSKYSLLIISGLLDGYHLCPLKDGYFMIRMRTRHPLDPWIQGLRHLSMPSVPYPKLLLGWERVYIIPEKLSTNV